MAGTANPACLLATDEPSFSDAAFRRRILDLFICGISTLRKKEPLHLFTPPQPEKPVSLTPTRSRLAELFDREERSSSTEVEVRRKLEAFEELKITVEELRRYDDNNRRRRAATELRKVAKDDPKARETAAMLGAIPPLVDMIESADVELQIDSLYALLNLGIANNNNKVAIVEAGAITKLESILKSNIPESLSEAIAANYISLSAYDGNKPIIAHSPSSLSFLIRTFETPSLPLRTRHDSLRALFNLSIPLPTLPLLLSANLVPSLLAAIGDMDVTDRALAVLSNAVAIPEGRRAVRGFQDAFAILVDILTWNDAGSCQEKAAYVLMVMAYKGCGDRTAMVDAGIVSALLELSLLGSPLAQRRAGRILECFRVDHGRQVSEGFDKERGSAAEADEASMSEEKLAVRELVRRSLEGNLRRIVRQANLPGDFAPSDHFRSFTASATSKSLKL